MAPPAKKRRLTKNEKRRLKKKLEKQRQKISNVEENEISANKVDENDKPSNDVEVIFVSASFDEEKNPEVTEFKDVFAKFLKAEDLVSEVETKGKDTDKLENAQYGSEGFDENLGEGYDEESSKFNNNSSKKPSRRERKILKRQSVAKLKQEVDRPDVVEVHDATSSDPHLLIHLKAFRNTVPIPRHWSAKRKYLQGKRGVEKPPWQLPDFIAMTGIEKIRNATEGEGQTAKQAARERVAPKMGRIDIDYQVLHDAFFKYQKKPQLSRHGDLYYEGAEFEIQLKTKKPGKLSQTLKDALGMPENAPPPWLINMQRYGPPPSYPSLKIPGLNAPIPKGASFGFHPGGWGKPPVDQFGKPLYGNVFDRDDYDQYDESTNGTKKSHWGEIKVEEESEEEEEEEEEEGSEEEEEEEEEAGTGPQIVIQPQVVEEPAKASEADERALDLRKGYEADVTTGEPKQLYKVLEQKSTSIGPGIHGSSHQYVVGAESQDEEKDLSSLLAKKPDQGDNKQQKDTKAKNNSYDNFKF